MIIRTILNSVLMVQYLLYALLSVAIRNRPAIASNPPCPISPYITVCKHMYKLRDVSHNVREKKTREGEKRVRERKG